MFADIRRFQELEMSIHSDHNDCLPMPCMLHLSFVFAGSLADDIQPSSTSDPNESERDRYLRSLGYTRYDDPYMLPTS